MAKRASVEEKVLQYFRSAPQGEMELVYKLVTGEVRARRKAAMQPSTPAVKPARKRRARVGKATPGTSVQTEFKPEEMTV